MFDMSVDPIAAVTGLAALLLALREQQIRRMDDERKKKDTPNYL
jgi:hypothetical protein